MNVIEKIKNSWWVILSFIMIINGFGFIYIGLKHNNKNWVLEGIMYEIPWFFYFIFYGMFGSFENAINPASLILIFAMIMLFVGIIRSIWIAIKLADVYDNIDKYAVNPVKLNNHKINENNNDSSSFPSCCLCLAIIFFIMAIIAIF